MQLIREAELLRKPSARSVSKGRLPRGTVATLTGERRGRWVEIEVELQEGDTSGWVREDELKNTANEDEESEDEEPQAKERVSKEDSPRLLVPKDEALLLRRESTFFYGIQLGGGLSFLSDESGSLYMGPSFGGGAHGGFFLSQNFPLRFELNYLTLSGAAPEGALVPAGTPIAVGFIDVGAFLSYWIKSFELYAGLQYSLAVSVNEIPSAITFGAVSDLSTLWISGGAGYRLKIGEITSLILRLKYGYALIQSPFSFQNISGHIFLEFKG